MIASPGYLLSKKDSLETNIYVATILVFGLLLVLESYSSDAFRYLKYGLMFFPLLIRVGIGKLYQTDPYITQSLYFYCIACLIQVLFSIFVFDGLSNRFFVEFFFMMAPLVTVGLMYNNRNRVDSVGSLTVLFFFVLIAFILEAVVKGTISQLSKVSISNLGQELLLSSSSVESVLSFNFGLFTIFFFFKKKGWLALIALVLLLISLKRIALAGLVLAFLIYILYSIPLLKRYFVFIFIIVMFVLNVMVPLTQIVLTYGIFDDFVVQHLGISTDNFLQGRQEIYQLIIERFKYPAVLGNGIGTLNAYLRTLGGDFDNVHSDLLKNLYEFGLVIYLAWLVVLFKRLLKTRNIAALCLAVYLNVVFVTDNVLIYYSIMLVFYLMVVNLLNETPGYINTHPSTKR